MFTLSHTLHPIRTVCQFQARHQSLVWAVCVRMKFMPALGVRLEAHACGASYGVSVVPAPATRVSEMFYPLPWGRNALYSQTTGTGEYQSSRASAGLHTSSWSGEASCSPSAWCQLLEGSECLHLPWLQQSGSVVLRVTARTYYFVVKLKRKKERWE